jgi:hypothetical protein
MNETLENPISTDLRVILIDETEHWSPEIQKMCGKISCAYLYDNAVNVFCAEITASKELTPLYYVSENQLTDDQDEELINQFCLTEESVKYMKLLPKDQRNEVKQNNFEFTDARSEEYKEEFEEMEDACKCNQDF